MRAGARGYVLKDADQDELVRAVKAVYRGEAIFSPAIAQRMIHYFTALPLTASALAFPELTDREREILHFIAQGESNADIAKRLVLSTKTVQNHVSNIFSKLQVADRAQAIVRARDAGLGHERSR
jgi:DNA-binding NarL/FixJ family response regulator